MIIIKKRTQIKFFKVLKKYAIISIIILLPSLNIEAQNKNEKLLDAALNSKEKDVFQLLKGGADPNTKNSDGITPLMYAADNGNIYICKTLIDHGAKINTLPYNGTSALHAATISNHTEIVQLLLENGANPDIEDKNQSSPLHFACAYGYPRAADLLLHYGANPNKRDYENTPLMITAMYGDSIMTDLLLKYKASPNSKGIYNNTPLMCAVQENSIPVAKILVNAGAEISPRNNENMSALDIAVFNGHLELTKYLLDKGAECSDNISKNISTAKIAEIKGFKQIKKILNPKKTAPKFTDGNLSFSITNNIGFPDYFIGIASSFHQSMYNIKITIGWQNRPFRKKILLQNREHNYTQYREYLSDFYLNLQKNFALKKSGYNQAGFFVGVSGDFYMCNYKGSSTKDRYFKVIPQAGFFLYKNVTGVEIGYQYSHSKYENTVPHRISINFLVFLRKNFKYSGKDMYY